MWLIGVEVEQETSAPLLKKILDPPLFLLLGSLCPINIWTQLFTLCCLHPFHLLGLAWPKWGEF